MMNEELNEGEFRQENVFEDGYVHLLYAEGGQLYGCKFHLSKDPNELVLEYRRWIQGLKNGVHKQHDGTT